MPGANGITGANAWSAADKDEYFRLSELTEIAEAERLQEAHELSRRNPNWWNVGWTNKADEDKFKQGFRTVQRSHDVLNRFYKEMDKKYEGVRAKKKSLAEDATKSFVFEKLKYAPPRMGLPGGPGYEEAKASFGKGRTRRRHRKSRRTRKH